jgi:hypothetical protein
MTLDGRSVAKRAEAGAHLQQLGVSLLADTPLNASKREGIGTLAGLDVEVETTRVIASEITVRIGDGVVEARWTERDWVTAEPSRLVTTRERRIDRLDGDLADARAGAARAADEAARAKARLGQPFEHAVELTAARRRQLEIAEALTPAEPAPAVSTERAAPDRSLAR